jgi:hypothetical protein
VTAHRTAFRAPRLRRAAAFVRRHTMFAGFAAGWLAGHLIAVPLLSPVSAGFPWLTIAMTFVVSCGCGCIGAFAGYALSPNE